MAGLDVLPLNAVRHVSTRFLNPASKFELCNRIAFSHFSFVTNNA